MKDNSIISETEINALLSWAGHVQEVEHFIKNEGNEYFFKEGVQLNFETIYYRQYEKFKQVPGLSQARFKECEIEYFQTWIKRIEDVSISPLQPDPDTPYFLQSKDHDFRKNAVYLLAKDFIDYLNKTYEPNTESESGGKLDNVITGIRKKKQYDINIPDKWFGLLHFALEQSGVEKKKQFNPESRNEAVDFGREHYGTNQDFYNEYKEVYNEDLTVYLNGMSVSDRKKWKATIKELSGNNVNVILWLKHKPE